MSSGKKNSGGKEMITELPYVEFDQAIHPVENLTTELGIGFPVRITDELWRLACCDDPAFERKKLASRERIQRILSAFYLAAEEAARQNFPQFTIGFSLELPVISVSAITRRPIVKREQKCLAAMLHADEEGQAVFTLGLALPLE